ncbi:MAG: YjbF family lipoprotein [Pseudomonadota bacterium]
MPMATYGSVNEQSRLRAALLRLRHAALLGATLLPLTLTGCASGGASPLATVFQDVLGDGDDELAARAAEIPFATLALDTGDRRGLVVLGAQGGGETYWPTGNQGLIALRHEALHATAGLGQDLLDTHYQSPADAEAPWRQAEPAPFRVVRTWQDEEGLPRHMAADATLNCGDATSYELPLATLSLEPCELALRWESGETTSGLLWRDTNNRRLWAGEEQAWPDGPTIRWEVARQWW